MSIEHVSNKVFFCNLLCQIFRVCWDFAADESEGFKKGEETTATQQSRELR
jgi:hypothetical protein